METEKRIVAFIDILGFKDLIFQYVEKKDNDFLKRIVSATSIAYQLLQEKVDESPSLGKDYIIKNQFTFKVFSDCICVSAPLKHQNFTISEIYEFFYRYISSYYSLLLGQNIYVRGAISIGEHFENEYIIFSEGLIKAYQLEPIAEYSRIIISRELFTLLKSDINFNETTFTLTHLSDEKGIIFLNPFTNHLLDDPARNPKRKKLVDSVTSWSGSNSLTDLLRKTQESQIKIGSDEVLKLKEVVEKELCTQESVKIKQRLTCLLNVIDYSVAGKNSELFIPIAYT